MNLLLIHLNKINLRIFFVRALQNHIHSNIDLAHVQNVQKLSTQFHQLEEVQTV
jgi:hypothetical protein